jgi:hypothetical protein
MVGTLLCNLIAQQCSVLASFSFKVLFIDDVPWVAREVLTLHHVILDLQTCARLKATTLLPYLVTSLSLVHQ